MPNESEFRLAGLLIVLLAGLVTLSQGDQARAKLVLLAGPFVYFAYYVGIVLTPAKLLGILFLFYGIFRGTFSFSGTPLGRFVPFWLYSVVLTFVMAPFWPDPPGAGGGLMYSAFGRWLTQFGNLALGIALAVAVYRAARIPGNAIALLRMVVLACVILSVYGIYIWFAQTYGLPYTTITRMGGAYGGEQKLIRTVIDGSYVIRAYSFCGEPKGLAAIASLGLVLLLFGGPILKPGVFNQSLKVASMLVMGVALMLTLSTAGYVVLPLGVVVSIAPLVYMRLWGRQMGFIIVAIGVLAIFSLGTGEIGGISVDRAIESRVEERVSEEGAFTYADAGAIALWKDQPVLLLMGTGLGGSTFYIRQYTNAYAGSVAAPRGVLGMLADVGIVGLVLFLMPFWKYLNRLIQYVRMRHQGWADIAAVVVFACYGLVMLLTYAQWYLQWVVIGMVGGAVAATRKMGVVRRRQWAVRNLRESPVTQARSEWV